MTGFELERVRPAEAQGGRDTTDYGVFLDQARLELQAEAGMLSAEISADLADAIRPETSAAGFDQPPYLRDAYLNVRFAKAVRLRAGRFKRPYSRLELRSSGKLPIRGRGLSNSVIVEDAQWGDRALALMLWGKLKGKLTYYVSASNPDWAPDADLEANGVDALARVEWQPSDALSLGINGGHKFRVEPGEDVQANAAGIDARLHTGALDLLADAILAQLPAATGAAASTDKPWAYGLVALGTYDIALGAPWTLQPVLSFEYADADAEVSQTEAVRVVAGLNLLSSDGLRVMPQVELVRPLGTVSAQNPWEAGERYYVMLTGEL
jgi:hypothetical protein